MPSSAENQAYFDARNRAMERVVEGRQLIHQSVVGFTEGLSFVMIPEERETITVIANKLLSESNYAFAFICGVLAKLEAVKGKGYLASWQKRGMRESAFVNLQRKFDRIDSLINTMTGGQSGGGESLSDNLGDLAVYAMKMIALQSTLNPAEVVKWLESLQAL